MGAWTVSHTLADGIATAAVGFAACVPLLRRIDVDTFAKDVAAQSAQRSAAALGWLRDSD